MAIISNKQNKKVELKDGSQIRETCEDEFGIPFGCQSGICGTCMIDILEGEDNLTELTPQEDDLARDKTHRLACQCKIKKSEVKIDY